MVRIFETELINHVHEYDVVLVGMGINNSFSTGFANDVAVNFPEIKEKENSESPYGDRSKYGTIYEAKCDGITFCMCYMHNGGYTKEKEYLSYSNLMKCLEAVEKKYCGKKIASPIIGSTKFDGNGNKEKILGVYNDVFSNCDIDVYDYEQETLRDRTYKEMLAARERRRSGEITKEELDEEMGRLYWIRENGIFKPMPKGYRHRKRGFSWENVIAVKKNDLDK